MSDYHQEQLETQRELERVYRCIENHLAPSDQALVRWAFGINEPKRWAESDEQQPLFIG